MSVQERALKNVKYMMFGENTGLDSYLPIVKESPDPKRPGDDTGGIDKMIAPAVVGFVEAPRHALRLVDIGNVLDRLTLVNGRR